MDFQERVRRRNEFDAGLVYGVKKFNTLTGRISHYDYREEHDNQWMNPQTGIIFDKFAEKRCCLLCGSKEYEVLFVKSGFPHVKCNVCDLVYVSPILNTEEYSKLWSAEDSWENVLESAEQINMQALEARYSLDVVELYLKNKNGICICDVGCGPGTLLVEAQKRGYYAFGIEPNKRCHKILAGKSIDFIGGFFPLHEDVGRRFDCVFLLNALEHMRNPVQIVMEAKKLIKPGGFIYVSVPCIDALVNRIMHEEAGVFGGHSHIQFFNAKTLSKLFAITGFEVVEYETIITELGVIKNYLSFKHPYLGDKPDIFDFLNPETIYKNHLARNINMLGRVILDK